MPGWRQWRSGSSRGWLNCGAVVELHVPELLARLGIAVRLQCCTAGIQSQGVISWVAEVPYFAAAVHFYSLYVLLGFLVEGKPAAIDASSTALKADRENGSRQ